MAEKLFLSLRARTRGCMPLMFDCSLLGVGRWRLHALTNSRYACTVQHLRGKISCRTSCWMHVQTLRTDQRPTVRVRVEATICAATEKIRYRTNAAESVKDVVCNKNKHLLKNDVWSI